MPRLIAFLRAINVGGHTVTMDELRRLFGAMGHQDVETFIASGNVIFTTRARDAATLERKIEAALHQALGYEVKTFLRTCGELAAVAGYQPFPAAQVRGWGSFHVGFLAAPLGAAAARAVTALRTEVDDLHVRGREVYWLCKGGFSDSRITPAKMEKALGTPATFRSVKTVARLTARYPA